MTAATPKPDAETKAAHLRLAEENFARHQETEDAARLTLEHPEKPGLFQGVKQMLQSISAKAVLTATTGIAAIALVGVIILPQGGDMTLPALTDTSAAPGEIAEASVASDVSDAEALSYEAPVMDSPVIVEEFAASPQFRTTLTAPAPTLGIIGDHIAVAPTLQPQSNTEEFANADANPVQITADTPVSTFSIDVDTASYSIMRSSLMNGRLPSPDQIRVEELINYFPYDYAAPTGDAPFSQTVTVTPTPWNEGTQLVHIGIQGELPAIAERPPLNLVFLIDTSGSMNQPNKLPLLAQSFRLMLSQLRPTDEVAIVTYAGSAGQVLAPTPASEQDTILNALTSLHAGGSTAGQAGLQQAYATAAAMAQDGEVSRVILATDGDFNVGISDPDALTDYISAQRDSGTYLSVLGFGRGNLNDATMQALAQNGNGQAAYIDTLSEAQKVLVDQLTGALFPIANDVKIQVEFNPAQIAEYRLIGYETRALNREDFNNDAVDAGEIGAGHSVTAIYEVTPVGSDAILNDALRYGAEPATDTPSNELGFLRLRYKTPGEDTSQLIEQPITSGMGTVTDDVNFATAIAGFGQLLRNGTYLGDWSYDNAITMATAARGDDPFGYRAESITLMRLADTLSQ
ncbi:vWA domain-containing protein [Cochlodiniinecator piscidefendens]|uniref:vWA domain-containing protein n=1 Tax=Cochlodiniinecator piscidefendens TaxID=2715756 RepID=UPI0038B3FD2C